MATILNMARGLNSIVALRTDGAQPQQLADTVAGTVDLRELYLLNTRETLVSGVNAAPVVGLNGLGTPELIVPAGELWFVWFYAINVTTGAAATIEAVPTANVDGTPAFAQPLGPYVTCPINGNARAAANQPFWAGPGTILAFACKTVTGAPTVNGSATITRLRI